MQRPPGTEPDRSWHKIDWELVACGFRGHELIGTDAAELRPEDALVARVEGATRWHRCLRCDAWMALEAPEAPTRRHPPSQAEIEVPLRGKALRDKVVLRMIAVDRIFHFVILVALGIAVLAIAGDEAALKSRFYRVLTDLQGGVAGGPVQTSSHVGIFSLFDKLFSLHSGTLRALGIALLAYGILEGVEAVGLWFTKRWAEYLTFIATTILLVPEIYELTNRATALKVIGFIINLAVVIYLLFAKRLFGLRGGGAADERLRAADGGWEAVARATPPLACDANGSTAPSPAR